MCASVPEQIKAIQPFIGGGGGGCYVRSDKNTSCTTCRMSSFYIYLYSLHNGSYSEEIEGDLG